MWIGTARGLNRLRGDRIDVFTTRDGLPGDAVHALAEDAQGRLWLGTDHGCRVSTRGVPGSRRSRGFPRQWDPCWPSPSRARPPAGQRHLRHPRGRHRSRVDAEPPRHHPPGARRAGGPVRRGSVRRSLAFPAVRGERRAADEHDRGQLPANGLGGARRTALVSHAPRRRLDRLGRPPAVLAERNRIARTSTTAWTRASRPSRCSSTSVPPRHPAPGALNRGPIATAARAPGPSTACGRGCRGACLRERAVSRPPC